MRRTSCTSRCSSVVWRGTEMPADEPWKVVKRVPVPHVCPRPNSSRTRDFGEGTVIECAECGQTWCP